MAEQQVEVRDNPDASRFEILVDGELSGIAAYNLRGNRVVFTHTVVDDRFSGQGLGTILARSALDEVIRSGKEITPICPFIAAFIRRHPEYLPHVDAEHRAAVS